MKKLWMILTILPLAGSFAAEKDLYITIGTDAVSSSTKSLKGLQKLSGDSEVSIMKISESQVEGLSSFMHDSFNRCGGFIVHETLEEAQAVLSEKADRFLAKANFFTDYTITEEARVTQMISQVKESGIRDMIIKLSSFQNRYYKSQTGVDSQAYVKETWEKLSQGRMDVKVDYFNHSSWPQPSVVMTVEGTDLKDEIIILGGHADSIAGWFGRDRARAPGADDNASGISTITEVIRVMMDSAYKPKRTVKFMAYAAEEVGLRGSKAIANEYKKQGKDVVGVVQFDMTNHKGSEDLDIVFMTDYTNEAQNKFMGSLIDKYVSGVNWGYSKCGYGCSDHASWHNAGYPASMPFESTMEDINGHIHTNRDTIDVDASGGTADHAEKFARLGVAYLVEMGK